ncbi:MAG: ATP synthase F0 subunit B [Bacillota bacterium]|nr:ATP synthase F0 subunit B [Bacillota bacterium]
MGDFEIFGIPVSIGTMIYQALLFTVLVFFLKKYAFKKIINIIEGRKQHIENQLELSEKYRLEAEKSLETNNEMLKQAKRDAREIVKEGERKSRIIIDDAREEAKQIVKEAKEYALLTRSQVHEKKSNHKGG